MAAIAATGAASGRRFHSVQINFASSRRRKTTCSMPYIRFRSIAIVVRTKQIGTPLSRTHL